MTDFLESNRLQETTIDIVRILNNLLLFTSSWSASHTQEDLYNFLEKQLSIQALQSIENVSESTSFIFTKLQWSCLKCTFLNDSDLEQCAICVNPKGFDSNNIIFY